MEAIKKLNLVEANITDEKVSHQRKIVKELLHFGITGTARVRVVYGIVSVIEATFRQLIPTHGLKYVLEELVQYIPDEITAEKLMSKEMTGTELIGLMYNAHIKTTHRDPRVFNCVLGYFYNKNKTNNLVHIN